MKRIRWQDYITIAPDLHHGEVCIRGTRIPVATILGSLADGSTFDEIKQAYPQLKTEDVRLRWPMPLKLCVLTICLHRWEAGCEFTS